MLALPQARALRRWKAGAGSVWASGVCYIAGLCPAAHYTMRAGRRQGAARHHKARRRLGRPRAVPAQGYACDGIGALEREEASALAACRTGAPYRRGEIRRAACLRPATMRRVSAACDSVPLACGLTRQCLQAYVSRALPWRGKHAQQPGRECTYHARGGPTACRRVYMAVCGYGYGLPARPRAVTTARSPSTSPPVPAGWPALRPFATGPCAGLRGCRSRPPARPRLPAGSCGGRAAASATQPPCR